MKLTEEIYAYEWTNPFENNCNSYYLGGAVQALVDPGLTAHLPDLLKRMEKDGIDRKDIRYIINTHCHPDHFQGSEYFSGNPDVSIGLNGKEEEFFNDVGKEMFRLFGMKSPDIAVDLPLDEGPLELGGESFQILLVPGHSPGSIALYWPARKALLPGDVIFDQNVGRTDFPGGSGALLKESIRRLSELEVEYLLPGHIGIVSGTEQVKSNFRFVMERIFPYI